MVKNAVIGQVKHIQTLLTHNIVGLVVVFCVSALFSLSLYKYSIEKTRLSEYEQTLSNQTIEMNDLRVLIATKSSELTKLLSDDQVKKNASLEAKLRLLKNSFTHATTSYEQLLKLKEQSMKTQTFDALYTKALVYLSKENYASSEATLSFLDDQLSKELTKTVAVTISASVSEIQEAPDTGYRRQKVMVDGQGFLVDIIAADLNSTKVIVDTASDSTCTNDCPVLSLSDYVSRNSAYAGINGSYFCPETYPSCGDKKNSFDTLLMNKNKVYFNSDNNVYSSVPLVVFSGNSVRFVSASQDWGRDTGVDAVLANRPLLVYEGNVMFSGNDDQKESSRSNRSFVAGSGNKAYIGVVSHASVSEAAKVLKTMGIQNAINLDSGGSTALWSGGYKFGPGRNIPNALLFVRK